MDKEIKPVLCNTCGKMCTTKIKISDPTGEEQHMCAACNKAYNNLKRNLLTSPAGPFVCIMCKKTFPKRAHFLQHLRHHGGDKPYVCSMCNKTFSWQPTLKRHLMTHTGEKPYVCDQCSKPFITRAELTKHTITHFGGSHHVCGECKVTFRSKAGLHKHLVTHSRERLLKCN